MFNTVFFKKYKTDYWHIVPIVLLLILAGAIGYLFLRYDKAQEAFYRRTFESQVFWAQENVENRVAHLRKEGFVAGDAIVKNGFNLELFQKSASDLLVRYPELNRVSWFDANGQWIYGVASDEQRKQFAITESVHEQVTRNQFLEFSETGDLRQTIAQCSMPIPTTRPDGRMVLAGFLQAQLKIENLLGLLLSTELTQGNLIKLYSNGNLIYSNLSAFPDGTVFHQKVKYQKNTQICDSEIAVIVVPVVHARPNVLYWSVMLVFALIGLSIAALIAGMLEKYGRFQAMREIEQQFQIRQAFENSLNVGIRIHAPNGYLTYVNDVFTRMVGYDAEEILYRPEHLLPYVCSDEVTDINEFHVQAKGVGEQSTSEYTKSHDRITRFKRKDGRCMTVLVRGVSLFDGQGNLTGWVTSVEDVTEKIQIEYKLKQEFSMRRAIEDALHVGVRVHDVNGRVLYANPAFYDMVGYGAEDVIGTEFYDAPYYVSDEQEKLKKLLNFCKEHAQDIVLMESSRGYFMPLKFKCRDGSVKDMIMRGGVMFDERGVLSGWVTSIEDVTEQKRLEDFKINETKRLETLQYLINLGEMASAISHELNQPLSAISGYAAGLSNYLLNTPNNIDIGKISEVSEKLRNQAERASKVTRRVQRFVKSKELNLVYVSIASLLEQTADLIEFELKQKYCQLTIHGLDQTWPNVYIDVAMVQHAIINIVRNSMDALVEFNPPLKKIDIYITRHSEYLLCLVIKDTGPGVPKEIIDSIFEPFFTTKKQGVGIGLNICRTTIESIGGHIWAKPKEEGGGFYITLPIPT